MQNADKEVLLRYGLYFYSQLTPTAAFSHGNTVTYNLMINLLNFCELVPATSEWPANYDWKTFT